MVEDFAVRLRIGNINSLYEDSETLDIDSNCQTGKENQIEEEAKKEKLANSKKKARDAKQGSGALLNVRGKSGFSVAV